MTYLFFYRYENGVEGFGYYEDRQEATSRMAEFKKDSIAASSKVEFGIAFIEDSFSLNLN
ncbi:MAG: hypothetical protein JWM44_4202 [Bacilli bacterium]|nr:hypothetical protein [Bacilli bacterium]